MPELLFSCSPPLLCWFPISEQWALRHSGDVQWHMSDVLGSHSNSSTAAGLGAHCSKTCAHVPALVTIHRTDTQLKFSDWKVLVLPDWLLNLKQWPALGSSVPQQSKLISGNRNRLSEPALCAPLSNDRLIGFPIILTCFSHPIIWILSK